jgi:hypothetical protein
MKKHREIWDSNRSQSQRTNNRGFWCGCDMCFVHTGQRCPECGKRDNPKKFKPQKNHTVTD